MSERFNRDLADRGRVLRMLEKNRGLEIPIEFWQLLRALSLRRRDLSPHRLRAILEYLGEKGCVKLHRVADLPGSIRHQLSDGDDSLDHIVSIQLTPTGLDVVQGTIALTGIEVN